MLQHEVLIDTLDMDTVQLMITASHSRDLTAEEREKLRKLFDRWQNALTLTNEIRVTF